MIGLKRLAVGTKIIVKTSKNGAPTDVILVIQSATSSYYVARDESKAHGGYTWNVYFNGSPNDTFILATRKAITEYTRKKVAILKEDLSEAQTELQVLEEFETEEDYVADKLSKILLEKDNPKAIAKILKELKKTDYL